MAKKRGRPALPIAVHLARNTFRPDRHGPRPSAAPLTLPRAVVTRSAPAASGDSTTGEALVAAIRTDWQADDPVGRVYLQTVGTSQDRRRTVAALLDGPEGLLAQLAAGKAGLAAKAVEVLLKAEKQASEELWTAIDRLHLEADAPSAAQKVAS